MNSQADDDIGFGIYTDIADLPMTGCPSYIEEGSAVYANRVRQLS